MHSAARGIWEAYVDAMKAIDAIEERMNGWSYREKYFLLNICYLYISHLFENAESCKKCVEVEIVE